MHLDRSIVDRSSYFSSPSPPAGGEDRLTFNDATSQLEIKFHIPVPKLEYFSNPMGLRIRHNDETNPYQTLLDLLLLVLSYFYTDYCLFK